MEEEITEKERSIRDLVRAVTGVEPGGVWDTCHGEEGVYVEIMQHEEYPDVIVLIWDDKKEQDDPHLTLNFGAAEWPNFPDLTPEVAAAMATVTAYFDEARRRQRQGGETP